MDNSHTFKYFNIFLKKSFLPDLSAFRRKTYTMKYFIHILFHLTILSFLFPAALFAEQAKGPELVDIIITTSKSHLLLFATVKNGFTEDMVKGVHNGIPITFNFHVELDAVRSGWFDSTLVEAAMTHTLRYNSFKEEYEVVFSEKKGQSVTTRSLQEAKDLMAEISGFPLIERKKLIPDAPYALKVKATLTETTLPLGMHYILPFTSFWNFETDWRTIEFHY